MICPDKVTVLMSIYTVKMKNLSVVIYLFI